MGKTNGIEGGPGLGNPEHQPSQLIINQIIELIDDCKEYASWDDFLLFDSLVVELNQILTGQNLAHFSEQAYHDRRRLLHEFLSNLSDGEPAEAIIYLGDGGFSRLSIYVDGEDTNVQLTNNSSQKTKKVFETIQPKKPINDRIADAILVADLDLLDALMIEMNEILTGGGKEGKHFEKNSTEKRRKELNYIIHEVEQAKYYDGNDEEIHIRLGDGKSQLSLYFDGNEKAWVQIISGATDEVMAIWWTL